MTKTEFRVNHSTIIEYYQYIEMRLKVICAGLLSDEEKNWFERLNDYETDPLGKLIKKIKKIQGPNNELLTKEDITKLKEIQTSRNYWAHQCFGALDHVTFKNGTVKKQQYADRLEADLDLAKEWDKKLAVKVHSLNLSTDFINDVLK